MRHDGRQPQQLRKIKIETNVFKHPEGSVMIHFGDTIVNCSATIEENVPPFLRETGTGWVTAEYSMLPRATHTRNRRESSKAGSYPYQESRLSGWKQAHRCLCAAHLPGCKRRSHGVF